MLCIQSSLCISKLEGVDLQFPPRQGYTSFKSCVMSRP